MAFSARELRLIVIMQNQASYQLARVGRDIRSLGRIRDMQIRRGDLELQQMRQGRQLAEANARVQSLTAGQGARMLRLEATRSRLFAQQEVQVRKLTASQNALNRARAARGAFVAERLPMIREMRAEQARILAETQDKLGRRRWVAPGFGGLEQRQQLARQMREQMRGAFAEGRELSAEVRTQAANQSVLRHRLNATTTSLRANNAAWAQNQAALGRARTSQQIAQGALEQTRLRLEAVNRAIANQRWERIGVGARTASHVGRQMQFMGLIGTAAMGMMAKASLDFNRDLQLTATQTGAVGTGMEQIITNADFLRERFLTIGADSTSSLREINQAGYDLFSTIDQIAESTQGLQVGVDMLQKFSDAAIAGGTSIDAVGTGVVSTLTAFTDFAPTAESVDYILNRMFAAVRFGRMTFAELAASLATTAPAAQNAGQSFDEMLGSLAFLSKPLGIAKARVGYARLMEIFTRRKMVKGMEDAGIAIFDAAGKMRPFERIVADIVELRPELIDSDRALSQFLKTMSGTEGTIFARRAFTVIAKDTEGYRRVLNKTIEDNNEFLRSLQAMEETDAVRLQKALNAVRVMFVEIGATVVPIFAEMLRPLARASQWFRGLDKDTQGLIGRWVAFAAVGTMLGGILLSVVGGLALLLVSLRTLTMGMRGLLNTRAGLPAVATQTATVGASAATAGGSIRFLSGQAGSANIRLLRLGGTVSAIVLGLPLLISNLDDASDAVGGLDGALIALNITFGLLALQKLAPRLLALLGGVKLLRFAIGGLMVASKAWLVIIPLLGVALGQLIRKIPGWERAFRALGGAIHWVTSRDQTMPDILPHAQAQATIKRINEVVAAAREAGRSPRGVGIRMEIERMFPDIDPHALDVWVANANRKWETAVEQIRIRPDPNKMFLVEGPKSIADAMRPVTARQTRQVEASFRQQFMAVEKMRKAAERAPTYGNWIRYYTALDELREKFSENQIRAMEASIQVQERVPLLLSRTVVASIRSSLQAGRAVTEGQMTAIEGAVRASNLKQAITDLASPDAEVVNAALQTISGMYEETAEKARRISLPASMISAILAQVERTGAVTKAQSEAINKAIKRDDIRQAIKDLQSGDVEKYNAALRTLAGSYEQAADKAKLFKGSITGIRRQILEEFGGLTLDVKTTVQDVVQATRQAVDRMVDNMINRLNEIRETHRNIMGTLFQGPTMTGPWADWRRQRGMGSTPQMVFQDLKGQINQFRTYQQEIARLRQGGAPEEMVQEVMKLGPEALPNIQAINRMTRPQREAYIKMWQESRQAVEQASQREFQTQLQQWRTQGRNIALAIIAGIRQEDARLRSVFRHMITQMLGSAGGGGGNRPLTRSVTVAQGNTTITVNAMQNESLDSVMRKAFFQLRHGR